MATIGIRQNKTAPEIIVEVAMLPRSPLAVVTGGFFRSRSAQSMQQPAKIRSGIVNAISTVPRLRTQGCDSAPNTQVLAVSTPPSKAAIIPPVKLHVAAMGPQVRTNGVDNTTY